MVLYFDVVLLINLFMNYMILYFVALLLNLERAIGRLFSGAALGCLFLLNMVWEKFIVLQSFPIKLMISMVMILVSFRPKSFREFIKIPVSFLSNIFFDGWWCISIFLFFQPKTKSNNRFTYN